MHHSTISSITTSSQVGGQGKLWTATVSVWVQEQYRGTGLCGAVPPAV